MKRAILLIMMLSSSGFVQASTGPKVTVTSPDDGSTFPAGSGITITASASDADDTISSVSFYNGSTLLGQSFKSPYNYTWEEDRVGTYTLTAVATVDDVSTTSRPVTVTVTPAPPVVEITSPANNTILTAGSTINLAASASEFNGTISSVSFYNGSTLLATGSMASSSFNYIWSNVPAGSYTLTAVATDTNKLSTTSGPVTVTVTSSSAPLVAIIRPANDSVYTAGSNIPILATASEANATITEVYFYDRTYYLGSRTISPYIFTWTSVPVGTYSLTVEATDSNGGTLISAPVNITVNPKATLVKTKSMGVSVPVIAITKPVNNSTILEGSSLTITVNASEDNGTIANVNFYNGTTLIGMSTTAPYTYTWGNVPAGTCTLTAQATDVDGVSTASIPVTVTVTKASSLPLNK